MSNIINCLWKKELLSLYNIHTTNTFLLLKPEY